MDRLLPIHLVTLGKSHRLELGGISERRKMWLGEKIMEREGEHYTNLNNTLKLQVTRK